MSTSPEIIETIDEIDEDENEMYDEDFQVDENMSEYESEIPDVFEEPLQLDELLTSVLATPDGDTVCSALMNIGHQLEVQNKILIKLLTAVSKK